MLKVEMDRVTAGIIIGIITVLVTLHGIIIMWYLRGLFEKD